MSKKTIVIGASNKPERYSYKAVESLLDHGHEVVPIGIKNGEVLGHTIIKGKPVLEGVHSVTLYLNPLAQKQYYDYIIDLKPERVIFNPGTENTEFYNICREKGIEAVEACTLVMLATHQY